MENNMIQQAAAKKPATQTKQASINTLMNTILDGEGLRKRFNELMGDRAPQFISSVVSLVNASPDLSRAMIESPMTVIQAALKAATFDLPIEPSLGYAHIVPFNDFKAGKMTANFIIGYKGLEQLCLRTGCYSRVPDAVDVREGELIKYDRLTGDAEFSWIEDEDERESKPVIGYAGYFRLKNGAEKTIYMTVSQIHKHEQKNRKGKYETKLARDDFDAYARKTVIRRLCSRYGLMSITYQNGDRDSVNLATAVMDDERDPVIIDSDPETGEVIENA